MFSQPFKNGLRIFRECAGARQRNQFAPQPPPNRLFTNQPAVRARVRILLVEGRWHDRDRHIPVCPNLTGTRLQLVNLSDEWRVLCGSLDPVVKQRGGEVHSLPRGKFAEFFRGQQ